MLALKVVEANYGYVKALKEVTLDVPQGKIVCLLGANGAGKTSTLKVISGMLRPAWGSVEFLGQTIQGMDPAKIVARGIIQAPEGRQIFPEFTVEENLRIGAYTRRDRENIKRDMDRVNEYFPVLKERHGQMAGTLSGGEQQMLAIARALMARPKLLLLDEPSLGLAPLIVREIFRIIKAINQEGTTILLVEQNAYQALSISHYGYILETGKVKLQGEAEKLKKDEEIVKAYLGGH
jgi:branched-chain amino acid transport system ATP-binding protein